MPVYGSRKIAMILVARSQARISAAQRRRSTRFRGRNIAARFAGTWRFEDYAIL
jgi:hypothetical protein